jgi:hypothetical protein
VHRVKIVAAAGCLRTRSSNMLRLL